LGAIHIVSRPKLKIVLVKNRGFSLRKCAFITGVTGQVGSQMADFLLENTDWNIFGMMRWLEPWDNLYHLNDRINKKDRMHLVYADLNDYPSMCRVIGNIKPDFVFHLAAQSFPKTSFDSPIETLQTNILGTANLLEMLRQLKESQDYDPVVHVCSSSEVYGKAERGVALAEGTKFHGASPYSISKIGTDYLGQFYGEAYGLKTFVTRMGTHSGPRRSDVFFESTLAKQIAMIEANLKEPIVSLGCLESVRTFQDARDAVRAYYLLAIEAAQDKLVNGEAFNIAGEEIFKLTEVVNIFLDLSSRKDISVVQDENRLRPIDADYQMFDNTKIKGTIDWKPEIPAIAMFQDLLDHWRAVIAKGNVPIDR
jgi:GDP-4-dehydro-6-deoxy-D-mannose reductase